MKTLVIGGGGREHSLAIKMAENPMVDVVYCAPGNAGTALLEKGRNVGIDAEDIRGLADFACKENAYLTVVGPEAPLVDDIAGEFGKKGLRIFGPNSSAAALEGSKVFTKELLKKYDIPTAAPFAIFSNFGDYPSASHAIGYINKNWENPYQLVIKGDGLAGGKAALVCDSLEEAFNAVTRQMIEKEFGKAGERIIIEPRLRGWELSYIGITDGKTFYPLMPGQDYKPIYDGNQGPNTGGMGGLFPLDSLTQEMARNIEERIMHPTIKAMENEARPLKGTLYAGLMITESGPEVLEFNVRFGDPENQEQMKMMKSDFVPYLIACTEGSLERLPPLEWHSGHCVGVVAASQGYPGKYEKGKLITGLDALKELEPAVTVYHAGTKIGEDGKIYTNGGRVLLVAANAPTQEEARKLAYEGISRIHFDGMYCRNDIGRLLQARS